MAYKKKFVLIDGNAIVHRSYHALPKSLSAPDGRPTNAVHGFTSILLGILEKEQPQYLATAFDMKGPTFRHETFVDYKATRKKADPELISQFPIVRKVLTSMNVPIFEKPGLEADDYLGIISKKILDEFDDVHVAIITGDQDALQLVRDGISVITPIKGYSEVKVYDRTAVKEKIGVWPEQISDYKGLRGDSSDNIPGVPGIGEKTAISLIGKFGSVEEIYKNIESVNPPRIRELLKKHKREASMSKEIAKILTEDGDLNFSLRACRTHDLEIDNVKRLFEELAFKTHLKRIMNLEKKWENSRREERQTSLF